MTAIERLKLASEILYKSPYDRATVAAHYHLDEAIEQLERERDAVCEVPLPCPAPTTLACEPTHTTQWSVHDDEVPF